MWPFKRTYPDKGAIELREAWFISRGTYAGKPTIVRINKGVAPVAGHPSFRHQVGVAVPFRAPDANGFPNREESVELEAIEDRLAAELGTDRLCLYAAAITTGGMREFVFYSSDPAATHDRLERLGREIQSHQLQHIIQPDPKWRVFRKLC
jgi:hypothetical protein